MQDEEIQSLHLPVVFAAVMNVLNVSTRIYFRSENIIYLIHSFTSKRMLQELLHPPSEKYFFYRKRFYGTSLLAPC
jgi:hypothetical protein